MCTHVNLHHEPQRHTIENQGFLEAMCQNGTYNDWYQHSASKKE